MAKVWNKRDPNVPKNAVYVGRPSKWGNPYTISDLRTREQAIAYYRQHIQFRKDEIKKELKGKDLVCWCKPAACHGDVLLEIANEVIDVEDNKRDH